MSSTRNQLESITDNDESSSIAPYNAFNSLTAEDSVEQIRKRNSDFSGDSTHCNSANIEDRETYSWMSKTTWYKSIEIFAIAVIIVLVWTMMALPTIFYVHHTVTTKPQMTSDDKTNGSGNITCTLFDETDTTCKSYLQQYTECLIAEPSDVKPEVYVSSNQQNEALEKIHTLKSVLSNFVRLECLSYIEPLICLYHFHLCVDETDIGPSQKQCDYVSSICDEELEWARKFSNSLVDKYLSTCTPNSPFDSKHCIITSGRSISIKNCSTGFYLSEDGSCQPECNVWTPYSQTTLLITNALTILPAVVGILSGVAVLLFSWLRCQKVYRYPSILVICQTIPALVLAGLVLVGVSARKRLFCSSRNLVESVLNPTPFCLITGITFYYSIAQLLLWWLWHTIAVFLRILWPFHAKKSFKSWRYFHIALFLLALILPTAPVLIIMFASSQKGGFTITRAPPIICAGFDLHTNFWAFIFPISLVLAVGVTLMVFIIRIVIKSHYLSKIHKIVHHLNWMVETKVLIVLCYYIILGAAVLSIFTNVLIKVNINAFIDYFSCERNRLPPPNSNISSCEKEKNTIQESVDPIPSAVAIVILGFLPVVNLVYVVKLSELRSKIKTCSQTRYVQYVQKKEERSTTTHYVPYNKHRNTTLQCDSMTIHANTLSTEPLITSHINKDLRK